MNRLLEAGVLVVKGARETTRRDETVDDVARRNWHIRYEPKDPDKVRAVRRLTASLSRQAERDFESGLEDPAATVTGATRNLCSLRLEASLLPREIECINEHLQQILSILRQRRPDDNAGTLCAMSWCLAPVEKTRGERRRGPGSPKAEARSTDRKTP